MPFQKEKKPKAAQTLAPQTDTRIMLDARRFDTASRLCLTAEGHPGPVTEHEFKSLFASIGFAIIEGSASNIKVLAHSESAIEKFGRRSFNYHESHYAKALSKGNARAIGRRIAEALDIQDKLSDTFGLGKKAALR